MPDLSRAGAAEAGVPDLSRAGAAEAGVGRRPAVISSAAVSAVSRSRALSSAAAGKRVARESSAPERGGAGCAAGRSSARSASSSGPARETRAPERSRRTGGRSAAAGVARCGSAGATDPPAAHNAVATHRSWDIPLRCGALAATVRWSRSPRVSSISEVRWPGPVWTKTRCPAAYIASVSSRKRTGSSRCRTNSSRTSASPCGKGAAVVPDHTGTVGGWSRKRSAASLMGARYGPSIGVWKPERNGSTWQITPWARRDRTNASTAAPGPQTMDWRGALSWESTMPESGQFSARAVRTCSAEVPRAANARPGTVTVSGSNSAMKASTWAAE